MTLLCFKASRTEPNVIYPESVVSKYLKADYSFSSFSNLIEDNVPAKNSE